LFDHDHNVSRFFATTDILANPSNYTIDQSDLEIAGKVYWNYKKTTDDVADYVDIIFGAEFMKWEDGLISWFQERMKKQKCSDQYFKLDDHELE
jgi:hypothetical protein